MLECSQLPLPFCIQVDICHDVSLAVAYLHSNDIIHRDLSSNNVLIIAGKRAKVTDFGMSKLSGTTSTMTPLTMCPGTLAYMPPEALREPPKYEKELDCFSEGVLMIQVCTRKWPEPGPRTELIQDSQSRTGVIEMPVPEIERRKSHIDLINPTHRSHKTASSIGRVRGLLVRSCARGLPVSRSPVTIGIKRGTQQFQKSSKTRTSYVKNTEEHCKRKTAESNSRVR